MEYLATGEELQHAVDRLHQHYDQNEGHYAEEHLAEGDLPFHSMREPRGLAPRHGCWSPESVKLERA